MQITVPAISSSVFSRDALLINSDSLGFVYNAAAVTLYDRPRFSDDSYNRVLSDSKNKLKWMFGAVFTFTSSFSLCTRMENNRYERE